MQTILKAKYALLALCAYVALMGALALTTPRTAYTQGTRGPDVRVNNTAAEPVPVTLQGVAQIDTAQPLLVRDADSLGRQPVAFPLRYESLGGSTLKYTVPAGKRLVIEYASGYAEAPPTDTLVSAYVSGGAIYWLPLTLRRDNSFSRTYTFAEATRLYFDSGQVVTLGIKGPQPTPSEAEGTFSGYLIDIP